MIVGLILGLGVGLPLCFLFSKKLEPVNSKQEPWLEQEREIVVPQPSVQFARTLVRAPDLPYEGTFYPELPALDIKRFEPGTQGVYFENSPEIVRLNGLAGGHIKVVVDVTTNTPVWVRARCSCEPPDGKCEEEEEVAEYSQTAFTFQTKKAALPWTNKSGFRKVYLAISERWKEGTASTHIAPSELVLQTFGVNSAGAPSLIDTHNCELVFWSELVVCDLDYDNRPEVLFQTCWACGHGNVGDVFTLTSQGKLEWIDCKEEVEEIGSFDGEGPFGLYEPGDGGVIEIVCTRGNWYTESVLDQYLDVLRLDSRSKNLVVVSKEYPEITSQSRRFLEGRVKALKDCEESGRALIASDENDYDPRDELVFEFEGKLYDLTSAMVISPADEQAKHEHLLATVIP
ncbi:hypothetical protein IT575_04530 [bacterium]|nr:hypothetical protein [bacterium]